METVRSRIEMIIRRYHLSEIESKSAAFACGKTYELPGICGSGNCWIYQPNTDIAFCFPDLHFKKEFVIHAEDIGFSYFSYYHQVCAEYRYSNGKTVELQKRTLYSRSDLSVSVPENNILYKADSDCSGMVLVFSPVYCRTFLHRQAGPCLTFPQTDFYSITQPDIVRNISQILYQIRHSCIQNQLSVLYFNSKINELLALCLQTWFMEKPPISGIDPQDQDAINELLAYFILHPQSRENLTALAVRVQMSKTKLTTLFKSITDMSVNEYRTQIRMSVAQDMLSGSSKSIAEIADVLGFSDTANFCAAFKKNFQITPSEYRALYSVTII